MADWETVSLDSSKDIPQINGYTMNGHDHDSHHSREGSQGSNNIVSGGSPVYQNLDTESSVLSEASTVDNSSERGLILKQGSELNEESRTEPATYENLAAQVDGDQVSATQAPPKPPTISPLSWSGSTAKEKAAKSPYTSSVDTIPDENITIPKDANISSFTINQIANFLRCFKVDDRIITHLHRKSVDGKRFSRLKDTELENLGLKNPVMVYFRDKSCTKPPKKKGHFML